VVHLAQFRVIKPRVGARRGLTQRQDGFLPREEQCVAIAAGKEPYVRRRLTLIGFERQRQLAVVGPIEGCGWAFDAARPTDCADTARDAFRPWWIMTNMNSAGITNATVTKAPSWDFFCMGVLLIFRFPA
jgi:hypothetical protein